MSIFNFKPLAMGDCCSSNAISTPRGMAVVGIFVEIMNIDVFKVDVESK